MWIFLKDSFLSIVVPTAKDCPHAKDKDLLAVRARRKGEIEAVFPKAKVKEWPYRDYAFRAFVPRKVVAQAMAEQVMTMTATNFKNTVLDGPRHDAYMDVWKVMYRYQNGGYHAPKRGHRHLSVDEMFEPLEPLECSHDKELENYFKDREMFLD